MEANAITEQTGKEEVSLQPEPPVIIISKDKMSVMVGIIDPGNTFSEQDLLNILKQRGVVHGIIEGSLAELATSGPGGPKLVARGTPVGKPKDEQVEFLFQKSRERASESTYRDRIDFRETFDVPSVEAGVVLAIKHPGQPGTMGITVTGEKVPPREPALLEIRAGKGAEVAEDGRVIKSVTGGRPWSAARGRVIQVGVEQVYRHQGDVDLKTGNIRFKGQVDITGNVVDGMEVHVIGKLNVAGFVSNAKITTGGDVYIMKGITGSNVRVGGNTAAYAAFEKSFEELFNLLKSIKNAVNQLYSASAAFKEKSFGQLVMILLDKKYPGVSKTVKQVQDMVERCNVELPHEIIKTSQSLDHLTGLQVLSLKDFNELFTDLEASISLIQQLRKHKANARLNSIRNSVVEATGSILVEGQGCFSSRLVALGKIQIQGVFRGGEIYAREGIAAGELGTNTGTVTIVKVDQAALIQARVVHPGTILQVGNRKYEVMVTAKSVRARLDPQGDVVM